MSRIDVENSKYHEKEEHAEGDFSRAELLKARVILRRLRFLETQMRINSGTTDPSSSASLHTAQEADGLEWLLGPDGVDFLAPIDESKR